MAPLGVGTADGEVVGAGGVGVGFALEGDGSVGGAAVAQACQAVEPLQNVDDVEGYPQEFALLKVVDALVADYGGVYPGGVAGQQEAE